MVVGTVDGTGGGLGRLLERFHEEGIKQRQRCPVRRAGAIPASRRLRQQANVAGAIRGFCLSLKRATQRRSVRPGTGVPVAEVLCRCW